MKKQRPVQITIRLHQDNEKEMRALKALQDAQQEGKTYAEILTEIFGEQEEKETNVPAPESIREPNESEEARITAEDVSRIVAEALKAAGVGSGETAADPSGEKSLEPKAETGRRFRPEEYPDGVWPPAGTPEYKAVMDYRLRKYSQACNELIESQIDLMDSIMKDI